MKKLVLMICLAGASLFYVHSGNVPLQGKLLVGDGMKSPELKLQVEAYQNATEIQLYFLVDLGSLSIEVLNEAENTVYHKMVKATAGSDLPIDTSSWEPGEYLLLITDKLGGRLEGYFVID